MKVMVTVHCNGCDRHWEEEWSQVLTMAYDSCPYCEYKNKLQLRGEIQLVPETAAEERAIKEGKKNKK